MRAHWVVLGMIALGGCEAADDAADAAAAGGTPTRDATATGDVPSPDAVVSPTPDAVVAPDDLPLGDCDPAGGVACAGALVCTPAPLPGLSACPTPPTGWNVPGCGPMPHPDGAGEIVPTCCTDADCGDGGRCLYTESETGCCGTRGETHCVSDACQTDADCPADRICLLTGMRGVEANTCVAAACRADADCAATLGAECRLLGAHTMAALTCVAPDAPCRVDDDCRAECPTAVCRPRWALVEGVWTLQAGTECDGESCLAVP